MDKKVCMSLDAMGGDFGPSVVVPAAVSALSEYTQLHLILVGQPEVLKQELSRQRAPFPERISIHPATEVVGMDESPSKALRNKKDSSMRIALDLVKRGQCDVMVSAGNTGALMATARFVLKMLPGVDRPAIISALPTMRGHTYVLDLGANSDCTAEQLYQFAVMGSVMVHAVDHIPRPRVGLLNIGVEEIKGVESVKHAARLLQADDAINYCGFVEGNDIYSGKVDLVVCDGFVGNVALKTSEGLAHMLSEFIRQEYGRNPFTKLAGLISLPVLKAIKRRMDPRLYNGASLLGLQGIVIKSHGGADELAFANAIRLGVNAAQMSVPDRIAHLVGSALQGQAHGGEQ
ncbi:phosphate acyltransferase PlsX [Candidatus Macondimonas diazotrophica]|jgi:glycerol-3-phosphate acyltransferase PlsX|uniref:Phosphate acyltransferase n=1 Tax=Candidatus Macondimonas diazotrophica TaxID=2305248 RepID=A0A4Z0FC01_9GAMM|nr:phosphate acyltransferase PlsX [Candidatus Macondimonas diazotrophica]NCU00755.1 phosphate acyltransferase PlsX [Candidatus Macondimonas diazotrophica]TFZ83467.1 phosphate acyltransferase PlsX [Candidatus Macondimonas diazotrophica]HBG52051.1 phosphate acyltransferase PlsX [Gammaproteobacteria bacterium]